MIKLSYYNNEAAVEASTWDDGQNLLWDRVCLQMVTLTDCKTMILTKDEAAQLEFALEAAQREIRRREDDRLNRETEALDEKYPKP